MENEAILDADALIDACISAGITVPTELLDDVEGLKALLNNFRNQATKNQSSIKNDKSSINNISNINSTSQSSIQGNSPHNNQLNSQAAKPAIQSGTVKYIHNYTKPPKKYKYDDFVKYFNKRYQAISSILKARKELQNVTSIARVIGKRDRDQTCIIGMVTEKKEIKGKPGPNGLSTKTMILTVEDPTGKIDVWVNPNGPKGHNMELEDSLSEVVLDEVIGILGQAAGDRVFATAIVFPDVPLSHELKKGREEQYAVFVGDVHVGANLFLKDEFEKMLAWLSGEVGTDDQREIAKKVKYAIFSGDLVEGVGIYPDQDQDLTIPDIKSQYDKFAEYMKMIPEHIQIVLIAGNHDAGRLQEPQTAIYKDFAEKLYSMPNVHNLSNPCMFTIGETITHPGFDVLLYHGYSLIYYANNVQPIRDAGGLKATDKIMKLLLKKRHLAPTHGCNTYVPDCEEDPLVIDRVPDFFITGHVHYVNYANYRGVTLLNVSCWSEVSEYQEKNGLVAMPARLPIVNLRTREIRVMNFYHGSEEKRKAMLEAVNEAAKK